MFYYSGQKSGPANNRRIHKRALLSSPPVVVLEPSSRGREGVCRAAVHRYYTGFVYKRPWYVFLILHQLSAFILYL